MFAEHPRHSDSGDNSEEIGTKNLRTNVREIESEDSRKQGDSTTAVMALFHHEVPTCPDCYTENTHEERLTQRVLVMRSVISTDLKRSQHFEEQPNIFAIDFLEKKPPFPWRRFAIVKRQKNGRRHDHFYLIVTRHSWARRAKLQ